MRKTNSGGNSAGSSNTWYVGLRVKYVHACTRASKQGRCKCTYVRICLQKWAFRTLYRGSKAKILYWHLTIYVALVSCIAHRKASMHHRSSVDLGEL